MPRIVLVGAGSVVFTRTLISDIVGCPSLSRSRIVLHDTNPDRLATATTMGTRLAAQAGSSVHIDSEPSLEAAIDGAEYVINSVAIGGFEAVERDFVIPLRYGVRQTIADTLGIGGIFRALRTIPVVCNLAEQMAKRCPQAWLLNYSNPMSMVPRAVYEGTPHQRVVGLCHSVRNTERRVAELVGVPREEIGFVTAGVNHQAFVLRMDHRGVDLIPRLREVVSNDPEVRRTVRGQIMRDFGFYPTESSEHGSEYVPWFLHHDEAIEHYRIPVSRYVQICKDNLANYEETKRTLAANRDIEPRPGSELAFEVIRAIETGEPRVLAGNVRNDGSIANLPPQACVEVPCVADRSGLRPTRVGALPAQLAALNSAFLSVSDLTVRAILEGRRDYVYQAALVDPNTAASLPPARIRALVDELIAAHGQLLPATIRGSRPDTA